MKKLSDKINSKILYAIHIEEFFEDLIMAD